MKEPGYVEISAGNWIPSAYKSLIQIFEFNTVKGIYFKRENSVYMDNWIFYYPNGIDEENVNDMITRGSDLGFELIKKFYPNQSIETIPVKEVRNKLEKMI